MNGSSIYLDFLNRKKDREKETRFRWCTLNLISRNRSIINSKVMGTHVYIYRTNTDRPPTLFHSTALLQHTPDKQCVFLKSKIVFSYLFSNHNVLKDSSILPYNAEKITIFNSMNFARLYACVIPILN